MSGLKRMWWKDKLIIFDPNSKVNSVRSCLQKFKEVMAMRNTRLRAVFMAMTVLMLESSTVAQAQQATSFGVTNPERLTNLDPDDFAIVGGVNEQRMACPPGFRSSVRLVEIGCTQIGLGTPRRPPPVLWIKTAWQIVRYDPPLPAGTRIRVRTGYHPGSFNFGNGRRLTVGTTVYTTVNLQDNNTRWRAAGGVIASGEDVQSISTQLGDPWRDNEFTILEPAAAVLLSHAANPLGNVRWYSVAPVRSTYTCQGEANHDVERPAGGASSGYNPLMAGTVTVTGNGRSDATGIDRVVGGQLEEFYCLAASGEFGTMAEAVAGLRRSVQFPCLPWEAAANGRCEPNPNPVAPVWIADPAQPLDGIIRVDPEQVVEINVRATDANSEEVTMTVDTAALVQIITSMRTDQGNTAAEIAEIINNNLSFTVVRSRGEARAMFRFNRAAFGTASVSNNSDNIIFSAISGNQAAVDPRDPRGLLYVLRYQ